MTRPDESPCPFCAPPPERVVFGDALVLALRDAFPVSPGHLLLVTRRHARDWFAATPEEQRVLQDAIEKGSLQLMDEVEWPQ